MTKDQYIILTYSKNNAGDYLIKYRAKQLFAQLRPDRTIIDYNAWEPFTDEQLDEVNNARALIILGGPSVQPNMRPVKYPMVEELSRIQVPLIIMGGGWKSIKGDWEDTHAYKFSGATRELLDKVNQSGYPSSVRDYRTLNTLHSHGYKNFVMSGCPALYDLNSIKTEPVYPSTLSKISFSLGVAFVSSPSMDKVQRESILRLKEYFQGKDFEVIFHHTINKDTFLNVPSYTKPFIDSHLQLLKWLEENEIKYKDISGSAENLVEHYTQVDLHIGYRVHAHIFMSSISRPTLLINEDGRGKALKDVISGLIFDGYTDIYKPLWKRLPLQKDPYYAYSDLPEDLVSTLDYEQQHNFPRLRMTRQNIDLHFEVMKKYITQLP